MANTSLTPELVKLTVALAESFAQSQPVVSAKARIGLFYQSPEATDLFRQVNEYGEKLRNKHMEGMPPSEEEIAKFDELRQAVVDNPLCSGFLEARQKIDDMLGAVNQYLCLAIERGKSPSDEEVAESMNRQMSACSCGGGCHGDCHDCEDGECEHKHEGKHECHCHEEGHECRCHEEGHECCGGEGGRHECRCGKH